jgi:hypothetical protein
MKKKTKVVLMSSLTLLCLMVAGAGYWFWGHNKLEIQVQSTKESPDRKWTAVVQMEVYSAAAFVDEAVYAVRLKGPAQKDRQGDLVMNMPVNYPDPAPSINWTGGKLVVTIADHEKYQYLANPVSGVPIDVKQK